MVQSIVLEQPTTEGVGVGWRILDVAVAARRRLAIRRTAAVPYIQVAPAVLVSATLAYGLVYMLYISLHSYDAFTAAQGGFSLSQYERLFSASNSSYAQILVRTLELSALVTLLSVALALPTAYAIVRTSRTALRSIAIFMLLVPFLMGESIRAFSWLLLLGSNGAVPWVIRVLGGGSPQLLGSYWAIVLGLLQVQVPLATLILIPGMRKVPADLERAAQIMGARPGAVWRRIIVPLTRPSLAAAAVVIFALCMTEYAIPSALASAQRPS